MYTFLGHLEVSQGEGSRWRGKRWGEFLRVKMSEWRWFRESIQIGACFCQIPCRKQMAKSTWAIGESLMKGLFAKMWVVWDKGTKKHLGVSNSRIPAKPRPEWARKGVVTGIYQLLPQEGSHLMETVALEEPNLCQITGRSPLTTFPIVISP